MTLMQFLPYPLLNQGGLGIIALLFLIAVIVVPICISISLEQLVFIFSKGKKPKEEKPFRNAAFKESLVVILLAFAGAALGFQGSFGALMYFLVLYIAFRSKNTVEIFKRLMIVAPIACLVHYFMMLKFNLQPFALVLLLMAINAAILGGRNRVKRVELNWWQKALEKQPKVVWKEEAQKSRPLSAGQSIVIAVTVVVLAVLISLSSIPTGAGYGFGSLAGEALAEIALYGILLFLVCFAYRKGRAKSHKEPWWKNSKILAILCFAGAFLSWFFSMVVSLEPLKQHMLSVLKEVNYNLLFFLALGAALIYRVRKKN